VKRSAPLQRHTPLKRGKPLRNTRRRRTRAEKEACDRFNLEVCDERPCFFATTKPPYGHPRRPGHICAGVLDAHHLIEKQWIRRYFGDLPEDELLEILYAPIIGSPLCRDRAHEAVGRRMDRIYFDELEDDLIDFCIRVDERYALPSRPSLRARLEIECPKREAAPSPASGRSSA
jgi:hypothetical protein